MNRLFCSALFAAIFIFSGCYTQIAQDDPKPRSSVVITEIYGPPITETVYDNPFWRPYAGFYFYYPSWDYYPYPISLYPQWVYYDPYFDWCYTYYPPPYWYGWYPWNASWHIWDYPYTSYWWNHRSLGEKYNHTPVIRNFGSTHGRGTTPLSIEPRRSPQRDANSKNPQNPQIRSRWQQKFNIATPPQRQTDKRTPQQTPQRKKDNEPQRDSQIRNNGNTRTPPQRDVRPPRQQQQTNPPERKPGRRP